MHAHRVISAEDLREGLGAVGKQMDKESVKKLARELDVSGCGSINLEVRHSPYLEAFRRKRTRDGAEKPWFCIPDLESPLLHVILSGMENIWRPSTVVPWP